MGYAYYVLPDGREAGYGVTAMCDRDDCNAEIDRGLDYLCGETPGQGGNADEPGCGGYFCARHEGLCPGTGDHNCTNPDRSQEEAEDA